MSNVDALRRIWSEGSSAFGVACMMPSAFGAEILAEADFDFLMIDCQHGLIGYDAMVPMLQAVARTGATPLVRVPPNDPHWIGSALDAGASGVVVPMVSSLADAEQAAFASHYPPTGGRSMGPIRSQLFLRGSAESVNRQVLTIAMIETVGGVESAEAICSCPGIDGVMIGAVDLALSMGLIPWNQSAELDDAVSLILAACRKHGVVAMAGAMTQEETASRIKDGYGMLVLGSDYRILRSGADRLLENVRAIVS